MIEIDFDKIHEIYCSAEQIKRDLDKSPEGFIFRIKIHRAHHYSDLAQDCLEAAFIGQQLTKFSHRLDVQKKSERNYDSIIEITLKSVDTEALSNLIFSYGTVYSGENEDANLEFMEGLYEFRDKLDQEDHSFPELVDDYYANYINGEYYEYDPVEQKEFFENEFSRFPERKYGFVKSAYSGKINQNFYTSLDSVIIPNTSNFELVLKEYSGIENIFFIKANFFAIGNITYLISNGFIVHFPFDAFIQAKHCAWQVFETDKEIYSEEGRWMQGFLTFHRWRSEYNEKENLRGYPNDLSDYLLAPENAKSDDFFTNPPVNGFYISAYGDNILVKDSKFSYFFFGIDRLSVKELGFLGNNLGLLFKTTANLAGIHVDIKCPWNQLDDETFEEVCFDIIYHNPKFDNNTVRKIGKSRSRDGGRDIVAFTQSRPGKPARKFIFQCKYLKPGSSLSASRLQNVSDTITQYGAAGYGILTNVVIDATLYDKLDGIALNFGVEIEDYSVYKLERILASYPQIKKRHFKIE